MAETHDSNQDEPGKEPLPKHKSDPAFMAEFTKAVEAYGKAASAGQTEQAEAAALQILSLAGEEAEHNPSPELLLTEQARVCEERGAWGDAEALYRKLLAMAEASGEAAHTKHGQIFQAHRHLCNLFLLLGEYAKAGESAAAALAAACAVDLSPLIIWALDLNAYCALRLQDRPSALAMAAEAVRTVEPGPLHDTLRAGAWVSRARCRVLAGDDDLAEQDLLASQPILFGKGLFDMAAGLHSRAASWWEVRASLCERRGDWSDALEAGRRMSSACGQLAPRAEPSHFGCPRQHVASAGRRPARTRRRARSGTYPDRGLEHLAGIGPAAAGGLVAVIAP